MNRYVAILLGIAALAGWLFWKYLGKASTNLAVGFVEQGWTTRDYVFVARFGTIHPEYIQILLDYMATHEPDPNVGTDLMDYARGKRLPIFVDSNDLDVLKGNLKFADGQYF